MRYRISQMVILALSVFFVLMPCALSAFAFSISLSEADEGAVEVAMGGGRSNVGTVSGCVEGSGIEKETTRPAGAFDRISIDGAFTVEIESGKAASVRIIGDDNILPLVRTRVSAGVLEVATKGSICPRLDLIVRISLPVLTEVKMDGSNDVRIRGLAGESFRITMQGASDAEVTGRTEKFLADIEGAGTLKAKGLISKDVRISISGSGDAEVYASAGLDAVISGAGDITYFGHPARIKKTIDGAGDIQGAD